MATTKTSLARRTIRKQAGRVAPGRAASGQWIERSSRGIRVLQVAAFNKLPWLAHGFSTRLGGVSSLAGQNVLNLGLTEWDTRESVLENRRRFLAALDANDLKLILPKQCHSDIVHLFDTVPVELCRGDAVATAQPGLFLGVQIADCVPILFVDPKKRAVAAVHAGWRGTLRRIAQKTVGRMHMEFDSRPQDLLAALGPSIGGCCYEVGTEVAFQFTSQFADASHFFDELRTGDEPNPLQWLSMMPPGHQPPPKGVLLDLRKANRAQLLAAGLPEKNIFVSDLCTACRTDQFFSYRKEALLSGRLMAVVGMRGGESAKSRKSAVKTQA